jgi:Cu/Ag efflux protein CusF
MFKKTLLIAVTIFAASVGFAIAQDYPPQDQPAQQENPSMGQTQHISGVVDKIDLEKKTISIKDSVTNESKEYTFNTATLFSRGTKSVTVDDLKKGDKVSLEVDAQKMVNTVRITPETQKPQN